MGKVKEQAVAYSTKKKIAVPERLLSPRQTVMQLLKRLKDNVTYEDIMYEVYVLESIQRGLDDIEKGNVVSHEEVKKRFSKWLK